MAQRLLDALSEHMPQALVLCHAQCGNETAVLHKGSLLEAASWLRDDPATAMDMPIDCTVVDWLHKRTPRFEVIWHLYSTSLRHRLRLKVCVSAEDPSCSSLVPLWPGMNWHEREAWDLYGIRFVGHPNLQRVLMYEEFRGHPLRKDYPVDGRQPLIPMRQVVRAVPTQRDAPPQMLNRP